MSHRAGLMTAILALLFLRGASCTRIERPYKAPTAGEVFAAVVIRGQQVRSLRAETRMAHQSSQGKVKATVRLMAERGGKLRFDAVSPFDTPLSTLVSDGKQFALVDARQNRHFHGPAKPCNIARLARVVLAPDDVLTILGGSTPLIAHQKKDLAWDGRAGAEVLTLQGEKLVQTIRLDGHHRNWDLVSSEIRSRQGGQVVLSIEASSFRKKAGLRAPARIHMKQPQHQTEVWVTFKKQELNLKLPQEAFTPPAANGLPSQRVDCETEIK